MNAAHFRVTHRRFPASRVIGDELHAPYLSFRPEENYLAPANEPASLIRFYPPNELAGAIQ